MRMLRDAYNAGHHEGAGGRWGGVGLTVFQVMPRNMYFGASRATSIDRKRACPPTYRLSPVDGVMPGHER